MYSESAYSPSSRPIPLCLKPPKGTFECNGLGKVSLASLASFDKSALPVLVHPELKVKYPNQPPRILSVTRRRTVPESIADVSLMHWLASLENTAAPSPYTVALANSTPSASVSNFMMLRTGPKILQKLSRQSWAMYRGTVPLLEPASRTVSFHWGKGKMQHPQSSYLAWP